MGMCVQLVQVKPEHRERVLDDADFISRLLYEHVDSESGEPPLLADRESMALDIDKSWGVIHYLLTGAVDGGELPGSFLLSGGLELEHSEADFGPDRLLEGDELARVAALLRDKPSESFRSDFDVEEMIRREVYPLALAWPRPEVDEEYEYFSYHYERLREFIARADRDGNGVLIHLG